MARNLKRWRQWRGLSQQEMAARLEMEPGAYGHWEAGRVELRARDLVRIAFALEMPLGTLLQALEFPIEDQVLSPGQWVDSGAPAPVAPTETRENLPDNRRAAAQFRTVRGALRRQDRGAGGGVIQSYPGPAVRELALASR